MNTPRFPSVIHASNNLLNPPKIHGFTGMMLFMVAFHAHYSIHHPDYYGTDEEPWHDIALGNQIGELSSTLFGVDFNDSSDDYEDESIVPWSTAFAKATQSEISQMIVSSILRELVMARVVDQDTPLYIVLTDMNPLEFFDDPMSYAFNEPDDDEESIHYVQLWSASGNMTVDSGWSEAEAAEVAALPVFGALLSYGDFAHNIIRIR